MPGAGLALAGGGVVAAIPCAAAGRFQARAVVIRTAMGTVRRMRRVMCEYLSVVEHGASLPPNPRYMSAEDVGVVTM